MTEEDEYFERLVDRDSLKSYLTKQLGETGNFEVGYLHGGNSNETLSLRWDNKDLVLRRPPPDETAETAHDILREYRILSALQDTSVPIPETILACEDSSILGSEFYLMERIEGEVIGNEEPDRFATSEDRHRLGHELIDTLADLHTIDYEAVDLADFGRPEGYNERQVERWTKQFEWIYSQFDHERRITELDETAEWLSKNVPPINTDAVVHGDYRLDNIMWHSGTVPKIVALLDWELSTLGDPLSDLGFLLVHYHDPEDPEPAIPEWTTPCTSHKDYPRRRELVERYEQRTGIEFTNERFYRTLATFKEAIAGEVFYARYLKGQTADPLYPKMEERVPAQARRCLRIIDGSEPL